MGTRNTGPHIYIYILVKDIYVFFDSDGIYVKGDKDNDK